MPAPTKRVRMTKQQQLQICIKSEQCPGMTNRELATWAAAEFNLPKCPVKSTILATLRSHARLRSLSSDCLARKEFRSLELIERDAVVAEFVVHAELERMPVSGGVIIAYAKDISKELAAPPSRLPQFTHTGWLRHFLKRHGFRRLRAHGESGSVDMAAIPEHMRLLRTVIAQYYPQDVFNMDETMFYYMAVPRSSVCLVKAPALKQNKARLTVAVTANADGTEKLPLLFLGKASCPRWLHEKPADVEYVGTSKGWMTVKVFQEWLVQLDIDMVTAGRKILLILDNAPVHIEPEESLRNVCVLKLPPNATSAIQPMDQGVIAYVKQGVMGLKSDAALYRLLDGDNDPYNVRLVDAIHWLQSTWSSMPADAIKNCWKHSGLFVDRASIDCILNSE